MKLDYQHYILLISPTDPVEAFNIKNLLESVGIRVLETSNLSGPYLSEIDGPLSQYDIYVEHENLAAARELLDSLRTNIPILMRSENVSAKVRIIPLLISALFFVSYLLMTNDMDTSSRYFLLGISLLFMILFLLTFRKE